MRLMFSLHLQTELRFVCNEAAVQDFIGDIFEPQSCEYTVLLFRYLQYLQYLQYLITNN